MKQKTRLFTRIILFVIALIQMFPLYWMIVFSLKNNQEIYVKNPFGLPQVWQWHNYTRVFEETRVFPYLFNSVCVTGLSIFFTLLLSSMATYALVRFKWKLRKFVYMVFLTGMMISMQAVLLPLYINLKPVLNTYWSLVFPYVAFNLPVSILIMVGTLEALPKELEEAAFIDGASIYKIFYVIILPLLRPIMSAVTISLFLSSWNELMFSATFISSEKYKTITVGVMEMCGMYMTNWGLIGAGLTIATIPIVIIYIFMSKNVQMSLAAGAVKG